MAAAAAAICLNRAWNDHHWPTDVADAAAAAAIAATAAGCSSFLLQNAIAEDNSSLRLVRDPTIYFLSEREWQLCLVLRNGIINSNFFIPYQCFLFWSSLVFYTVYFGLIQSADICDHIVTEVCVAFVLLPPPTTLYWNRLREGPLGHIWWHITIIFLTSGSYVTSVTPMHGIFHADTYPHFCSKMHKYAIWEIK